MSASKNLGKVFMTPKGIWDKTLNYTKLDIVTNKVGKISCGYIATTDIEKNVEITDNRWLKLFELLDGDLTEEYKAVQTDVTNKATDVDTNKKAVDLIYSQMQKLYDVEISTTTPTNERTGLWINPDDISGVINIPEIKDDEVSDVDTWSSKKIDNVTNSLKEDLSTKITKFYASSQGETHLADSDNGKIMDMMIYGKSDQKQYSGKNLLNATLQTTTKNGVTCTANGDGTYTLNGTATARTEFIISVFNIDISKKYKLIAFTKERSYINCFVQLNQSPWTIYGTSSDSQVTITDSENIRLVIAVIENTTLSNEIFKPMIVDASLYPDTTYDDYEPYTGGIPSPNPDYPQEIKSVVNPTVKVCGKNLLKATLQTTTENGITCTNNGDGTYTLNGTATADADFTLIEFIKISESSIFGKTVKIIGCPPAGDKKTKYAFFFQRQLPPSYSPTIVDDGNGSSNLHLDESVDGKYIAWIRIISGHTCNNVLFKPMIVDASLCPDATYDDYEPYHEQTVTLPYTLNAIPVSAGGNVTIDGQQYVSDYFDVERGKLVRCVLKFDPSLLSVRRKDDEKTLFTYDKFDNNNMYKKVHGEIIAECSHLKVTQNTAIGADEEFKNGVHVSFYATEDGQGNSNVIYICVPPVCGTTALEFLEWSNKNAFEIIYKLATHTEIDLTKEEIAALKALVTYYPTTNISVNSEQLDGYTVFNYPISMANGWNYVKQQIGDTRNYIYDMDIQSAEAYVNSEYAVALTELEV